MTYFLYIVGYTLIAALDLLSLMMLVRAIMSWINPMADNKFMLFINGTTELVIDPVRRLLSRFEFIRRCPIDLSFIATWMLLSVLQTVVMNALLRIL